MPSAREIFFTKADEAALSRELREKYPNILFAEKPNRVRTEPDITLVDTIDAASTSRVEFFVAGPDWQPVFGPARFGKGIILVNRPECCGFIDRSSDGWGPNEFNDDGEPRWITEGRVHINYNPPPTKVERSFRDTVWRMFPRIGTWRLKQYHLETRRLVDWEKTDKMLWAGDDAIRWANAHPMRMFSSSSRYLYRPIDDLRT